jgi:hypothetical protein
MDTQMSTEQAILTIPSNVAAAIRGGSTEPLDRRLLELAAIQAHESDLITEREVMEMLGFEDREELYAFFKRHDVRDHSFTVEELERGRETMAELLDKR